ncbi:hypothetical protein D3C84_644770 [compost metagenome]
MAAVVLDGELAGVAGGFDGRQQVAGAERFSHVQPYQGIGAGGGHQLRQAGFVRLGTVEGQAQVLAVPGPQHQRAEGVALQGLGGIDGDTGARPGRFQDPHQVGRRLRAAQLHGDVALVAGGIQGRQQGFHAQGLGGADADIHLPAGGVQHRAQQLFRGPPAIEVGPHGFAVAGGGDGGYQAAGGHRLGGADLHAGTVAGEAHRLLQVARREAGAIEAEDQVLLAPGGTQHREHVAGIQVVSGGIVDSGVIPGGQDRLAQGVDRNGTIEVQGQFHFRSPVRVLETNPQPYRDGPV